MSICHIYSKISDIPEGQSDAYALEDYLGFGSVQKAAETTRQIFLDPWNQEYIKNLTYQGYEISWAMYDTVYHWFSLPFSEIQRLCETINTCDTIVLHNIDERYTFVITHFFFDKEVKTIDRRKNKISFKKTILSILAFFLTLIGLLYFAVFRRKVAVWTMDTIARGSDSDFRFNKLYENLRKNKVKFVEIIRLNDLSSFLKNIIIRRRPAIYYQPILYLFKIFTPAKKLNPQSRYHSILLAYDRDNRVLRKTIPIIKAIYKILGIKSLWSLYFTSRNAALVIAAKCAGIKTVGMKHGAGTKDYDIFEFMPAYWSEKKLGPDAFGVWSPWWKEYFLQHSKALAPQSIHYAGLLRPYAIQEDCEVQKIKTEKIRILLLSEPLTDPGEIIPYVAKLAKDPRFLMSIKVRPMVRDVFYEKLKELLPETQRWPAYAGNIFEDGKEADVFIGSHTTALLEASLIGKIAVFLKTQKWGDYFNLAELIPEENLLADNPDILAEHIIMRLEKESDLKTIEKIKNRYFGDNQDGTKWAVSELCGV